jgi:hypothetical protein
METVSGMLNGPDQTRTSSSEEISWMVSLCFTRHDPSWTFGRRGKTFFTIHPGETFLRIEINHYEDGGTIQPDSGTEIFHRILHPSVVDTSHPKQRLGSTMDEKSPAKARSETSG